MAASHSGQLAFPLGLDEGSTTEAAPAVAWERDAAKRALDELFSLTLHYKFSRAYQNLLHFVARFTFYSPFNALLVHVQKPGAVYVAPAHRWLRDHGQSIKPTAQPLVILQPRGPVMFVFDVSDTEPTLDAKPLPPEVDRPFHPRTGHVGGELGLVVDNAKRDGVRTGASPSGSQSAGFIGPVARDVTATQKFQVGFDRNQNQPVYEDIPVKYDLVTNANLSREGTYATIVHELAHLYCGHIGTPDPAWWPDRQGLDPLVREFEAESVAYLVCARLGIDSPSEAYLSHYYEENQEVPALSLECIMKAAGLIEAMSRKRMKRRKTGKSDPEV